MAYVILDPIDDYAEHMMKFLARNGHGAVAVFTTAKRQAQWRQQWVAKLGHTVLATYSASAAPTVEILAAHIRESFPDLDGIIPWDERNVLYGALLGEALGLDWNAPAVIERCRDKGKLKEWIRRRSDVRVNAGAVVETAEEALRFQRRLGTWPVVVKPTGGAGSTDVSFPTDDDELLAACQRVKDGGSGEVLLEEYVGGKELAVNGLVDHQGGVLVTDIWAYDKRPSHGVDNVCFGAVKISSSTPGFHHVAEYADDVIEVVGLRRAPFHMEVKVDARGPCLIELGPRFAGGQLPALASALHERDLFELTACHFLAELPLRRAEVNFAAYDAKAAMVVQGAQPHALGRIQRVDGVAEVERLPSFAGFGLVRPVGAPAPRTIDLKTRAWELYLIHPNEEQVEHDAAMAWRLLRYS
jgi:hypothetical protein